MKTIITAQEASPESKLDSRFGRCAFFCLHDSTDGQITFIQNEFKDAQGGAGTKVVEKLLTMKVDRIISGDFGPKAKDILDKFKIQLVKIHDDQKTIKEIISTLK